MVSLGEGEVAQRYRANNHKIVLAEMQLCMSYTPQNAPCFCLSGSKFKHCHGKMKMK
jgi:uncharacterized protein YchJ